jgi:4-amino-4-deoxy-L-arabinose transferase-like glycosyltransferase
LATGEDAAARARRRAVYGGLLLGAVLAVTAALRLVWLDRVPPGWHHDEALMGVMASEVYRGVARPIFFPQYLGQEPLYIYLAAGMEALLGGNQDILPLRLTSALIGSLTVGLTYLMARAMFGRRVGLLAAALVGVNFWQVMSSRNAYRSITQPLVEALAVWLFWRAGRLGDEGRTAAARVYYALAGATVGGVIYTYLGGRAFPGVFAVYGLWLLWTRWAARRPRTPAPDRGEPVARPSRDRATSELSGQGRATGSPLPNVVLAKRSWIVEAALFVGAAVFVAAPLSLYWLTHPGTFAARLQQASVFSAPEISRGSPVAFFALGVLKLLATFTISGDPLWRYNIPGRPVFVGAVAVCFYAGLAVLARRAWRRDAASAFILIWLGVMAFPSVLSWDVGAYTLRAMGLVPALMVVPAVGLDALWSWLSARGRLPAPRLRPVLAGLAILVVAGDGLWTTFDYFYNWAPSFGAAYEGDADTVAAARYLAQAAAPEGETVFVGSKYLGHPIVAQLAPAVYDHLRWSDGSQSLVYPAPDGRPVRYIFPFTTLPPEVERYLPAEARVAEADYARGIGNNPPPPLFVAYRLTPEQIRRQTETLLADPGRAPLGVGLGDQIEAVAGRSGRRVVQGAELDLEVIWRVLRAAPESDYTMYVHLLDANGQSWAETDANGFPSAGWRAGDLVVARYRLPVPKSVPLGLYRPEVGVFPRGSADRLTLTAGAGPPQLPPVRVVAAQSIAPERAGHPINATFADDLRLLGYEVAQKPGASTLPVILYWQAVTPPDQDYTVFVQLLDGAGQLAAQLDSMPAGGRLPTSSWEPGEVIADPHEIPLPPGLAPGKYRLIAGLYLLASGQRLPLASGGDFVTVGEVTLP